MTQYQVTLYEQTLQRLFSGDEHVAQLLESLLNQAVEAQVSERLHAERYERSDERQCDRNGYKTTPSRHTSRHLDAARHR